MSTTPRTTPFRANTLRGFLSEADRAASKAAVSYALIIALQVRVIWDLWKYKDLTPYDTANYFVNAASWAHGAHESIVYSPLYAAVWGTTLTIVHDVYATAVINRLAIVLAVSLLVLAAARALLTPAIALLVAIWWVVNPANYNVLYDVHLVGLLPVLVAVVVVARTPSRRGLGIALGLLVADTALLRNEMLLASLIFVIVILVYEVRARRGRPPAMKTYAVAYGIPVLVAALLIGGAYSRSYIKGHEAVLGFEEKQTTNLCEAYAFNYQQRYPSRVPGDAFLNCQQVMKHDFGRQMPTLFQALAANPRAMAGFVAWNFQLLPSGTEVALFGATSTGTNPAYPPPRQHEAYALVLAIFVIILVVAGLVGIWRQRPYWWRDWARPHLWPLAVLGSAALGTLIVVLTERPWVDYMYPFTFALLIVVGVCVSAILREARAGVGLPAAAALLAIALVVALPSYYTPGPRPIHDALGRLQVIDKRLEERTSVLVAARYSHDVCDYLARSFDRYCSAVDWPQLRPAILGGAPIRKVLDSVKATTIYADATMVTDPALAHFLAAPQLVGWRQVAAGTGREGPWRVLVRVQPPT